MNETFAPSANGESSTNRSALSFAEAASLPLSEFLAGGRSAAYDIDLAAHYRPAAWSVISGAESFRRACYEALKRMIDIGGAALLLIFCSPLLLLIAAGVKLTSPGPILFKHRRIGRNGRDFDCLKFRTMVQNAEQLLQHDAGLRRKFETNFKLKNDPRITRLGGFLRETSMDELPQLWNVLRGDISLIGPRPVVAPELCKYGPHAPRLLQVKPGLSGLWQTCGRSTTSYPERVQLDMLYIEKRSTWLDLRLMTLTVGAVLRRMGAC